MKGKYIDLTGQRFGKLVVLHKSEEKSASHGCVWLCKCDCGKEVLASTSALNSGKKKSCGCLALEHAVLLGKSHLIDIIGKKFGKLTVLERIGNTLTYKCKCDCGNETIVIGEQLRSGKTKSCGCLKNEDPPNKIGDNNINGI